MNTGLATLKGLGMASLEVPQILTLYDRVAVLSKGLLAGILGREEMSEDRILTLAFREH